MYKSPEQEHTTVLAYACGRTLHPRESEGIILLQAVLDGSPPGLHPEQIAEIEAALQAGVQAHKAEYYPVVALGESPERPAALERAHELAAVAKRLGSVAISAATESVDIGPQQTVTLANRIKDAAQGSVEAGKAVEANALIDLMERAMKAGFVTRVILDTTPDGKIIQHGQLLDDVTINTFNFYAESNTVMRGRGMAEGANGVQDEWCYRRGDLRDNYRMIMSRPADELTDQQLEDEGFFAETMSIAVQFLHELPDGRLELISYFVAGKSTANASRNDAALAAAVGDALGQDWHGLSATELLHRPVLIPKAALPDGPVSVIQWMDRAAGGTFFGQDRPVQDYQAFEQQCAIKQDSFTGMAKRIRQELVANAGSIRTAEDAVQHLAQLSQDALVERATYDHDINPHVFGPAAQDIFIARELYARGAGIEAGFYVQRAKSRADSTSCPGGARTGTGTTDIELMDGDGADGSGEDSDADCEFTSLECPECHAKYVHTVVSRRTDGKKEIRGSCGCVKVF